MEPGAIITENFLIKQAVAGDRTAFGEIYTLYLDAIYRYIYYRVGDTHDAEDLTEQVFLKAWKSIKTYKDQGIKFSSWLYRIAHNIVIDFHRKCAADARLEEDCKMEDEMQGQQFKQKQDLEEASALSQAIARLTDEQQQIILLRFIEGLSHAEAAQIMNKSEGACRMLQNRALVELYEQLKGI